MKRFYVWVALAQIFLVAAIWLTVNPYIPERRYGGCIDTVNRQYVARSVVLDAVVNRFQTREFFPKPSNNPLAEYGCAVTVEYAAIPIDLYGLAGLFTISAVMTWLKHRPVKKITSGKP